jgi:hypothetical protein
MIRLGFHFDQMARTDLAQLERYVFQLMRYEAREKRHLQGLFEALCGSENERRRAHRVNVKRGELLAILETESPGRRGSGSGSVRPMFPRSGTAATEACQFDVVDISITGCSLLCPTEQPIWPGMALQLTLKGGWLSVRVLGTVTHRAAAQRHQRRP